MDYFILFADSYIVEPNQPCTNGTQTWPMRGHRRKPSRGPELPILEPLPVSVLFDMRYYQSYSTVALFSLLLTTRLEIFQVFGCVRVAVD
jgi:hypothetical protein